MIMRYYFTFIFIVLLLLSSPFVMAQTYSPSDSLATKETRWLFSSMQRLVDAGVMIGHHDDLGRASYRRRCQEYGNRGRR